MGNGDAKTDAGAHRLFTRTERGKDGLLVFRFDFPKADKHFHQLDDSRPPFGRLHLGNNLVNR
jgi:hypothetical protein